MSQRHRLSALEAAIPDPVGAGRRCPACGGLNWADAANAYAVLERGQDRGDKMPPEVAEQVMAALEAGTATCELCGAGTLHGALAELRTVPDDVE